MDDHFDFYFLKTKKHLLKEYDQRMINWIIIFGNM